MNQTRPMDLNEKPSTVCVYEGSPSVTVRIGELGNRYGLCADCARAQDAMAAAGSIFIGVSA